MRVGGRERETKSRGEGSGKYYIILCTPPQDHGNSLACAHNLCTCSPESGFFQLVKIKLQDKSRGGIWLDCRHVAYPKYE